MTALEPYRQPSSPLSVVQLGRTLRRGEITTFRNGVNAAVRAECDRQDAQAVADACAASLDCELDLLDYGLSRAGNSAAKAELVARKVARLASLNDSRINRRFAR
jgi:hypothetical protein